MRYEDSKYPLHSAGFTRDVQQLVRGNSQIAFTLWGYNEFQKSSLKRFKRVCPETCFSFGIHFEQNIIKESPSLIVCPNIEPMANQRQEVSLNSFAVLLANKLSLLFFPLLVQAQTWISEHSTESAICRYITVIIK